MQVSADPLRDAAPELLETLKLAVARVKLANDEGDPVLSAWLPGALATIAKAEGRSASLNPAPKSSPERILDALQRAERFMSGFEDDPLQEDINDDLGAIRSAIAELEDGSATSTANGTAAPGTPPVATAPLPDHSRPFEEARAGEEVTARAKAGLHESAGISKSCHKKSAMSTNSTGVCE